MCVCMIFDNNNNNGLVFPTSALENLPIVERTLVDVAYGILRRFIKGGYCPVNIWI